MIRNNQNGRRRGRGGARPPQAGGGPSGNYGNAGGNRMDVRQRGNATQLLEKYKALARDATQGGDRVQAEYYMQYADHYYRVLNEFRARDPQPAPRSYDDEDGDQGYNGQGNGQTYAAPQNYAPPQADGRYADEVDDGDDEDEVPRRQAAPVQNGNDRQDRVRGGQDQQRLRSPSYARDDQRDGQRDGGQRDSGNRDTQRDGANRDNGQRETFQRENAPRDSGQRDNAQRDNGQRDNGFREFAPRDGSTPRDAGPPRENGRPRDSQPRFARTDVPQGDRTVGDPRGNGDGRGDRRPRRDDPRRDEAESRRDEVEPLILTIPGLPGPATVAAPAPAAVAPSSPSESVVASAQLEMTSPLEATAPTAPQADLLDAEPPAPRRRGRPRKVVVTADESTGDA